MYNFSCLQKIKIFINVGDLLHLNVLYYTLCYCIQCYVTLLYYYVFLFHILDISLHYIRASLQS